MHQRLNILALAFSADDPLPVCAREILDNAAAGGGFAMSQAALQECGSPTCPEACMRAIQDSRPDLLLVCLPEERPERARAVVRAVRCVSPDLPILALANATVPEEVFELLAAGAQDFLLAPLRPTDLLPRVWRLCAGPRSPSYTEHNLKEKLGLKAFVGESAALLAAIRRIPSVAQCNASVLILGETGSGKEICARAIHYLSDRSEKAFVALNCGAIPVELAENQLFGHEQGAFTGANAATPGLLRAVDGGTLFLDEVDALPLGAQVKLLRFLQEGEFQPLGSTKTWRADVRIIAASNTNLEEAVKARRFRQDLYYRLNVVPIELPPLRQRTEDIPLLARHFLDKYANQFNRSPKMLSPGAVQRLMAYAWPGNVRELENIIERAVLLSAGPLVSMDDIQLPSSCDEREDCSFKTLKAKAIREFEKCYVQELLTAHEGNIARAAVAARKHRRAFFQLMRKHGIKAFRPAASQ